MTSTPPEPLPDPPAWGRLIRRVRLARGLTLDAVATRVVELFGGRLSASRLSQIETGYHTKGGKVVKEHAQDYARLAHIAYVVGVTPDRLAGEGERPDAAEILEEIAIQLRAGDTAADGGDAGDARETEKDKAIRAITSAALRSGRTRRAFLALAEAMDAPAEDEESGDGEDATALGGPLRAGLPEAHRTQVPGRRRGRVVPARVPERRHQGVAQPHHFLLELGDAPAD